MEAHRPSGFFVLRTPLLPFKELSGWSDEAAIRHALSRPEVREALYLASPDFAKVVDDWVADPSNKRGRKALPAAVSYLTRMTTRCTPFGMFAGVTLGHLGPTTSMAVTGRGRYCRHTRLDCGYLAAVVDALEQNPAVRRAIRWETNSSVYRAGGRLRYTEARTAPSGFSYHLCAVDGTAELRRILAVARHGSRYDELARSLVDDDIAPADAEAFLCDLIDAQLLVSELRLELTGEDPLPALVERLLAQPETQKPGRILQDVRVMLSVLDANGLGRSPEQYHEIEAALEALEVEPGVAPRFQVDLVKPAEQVTLARPIIDELSFGVKVLHAFSRPRFEDELDSFKKRFLDRYGERDVPLAEALDEDIGVGVRDEVFIDPTPLLVGVRFPMIHRQAVSWDGADELLLRKVLDAVRSGSDEITVEPGELAVLDRDPPPLPDAFEVRATATAGAQSDGHTAGLDLFIHSVSGAPGVRLLGRFCHADRALHEAIVHHLRAEEALQPDAVFAEIVHLPEDRLANILCRPVLRAYEIPFLGRSGAAADAQLLLEDLYVCVIGDRIVLRSLRLGREVLPRLTSAHNFRRHSVNVYRFLCMLAHQGVTAGLSWSWGPLQTLPYLPRVRCGRILLARAQWRLIREDVVCIQEWRAAGRLPRYVAVTDGEDELLCDLDNALSLAALTRHLHGRAVSTIVEATSSSEELIASGPEGKFAHEVIVPFVRGKPRGPTHPRPPDRVRSGLQVFPPGSEWLYAKLYSGPATADHVLAQVIAPIVAEATAQQWVDRWYFIRYGDPEWHLRVRFHGDQRVLAAELLPRLEALIQPLLTDGTLWRFQLDTYSREVEAYGGEHGIDLAEQVFCVDSETVLGIMSDLPDDPRDARWQLALLGIDRLLVDFGLDLAARQLWSRRRRDAFAAEFGSDARLRRSLGEVYRRQRSALEELLQEIRRDNAETVQLATPVSVFDERSARLEPVVRALRDQRLTVGTERLLDRYTHMHANRLLRSGHRAQEFIIAELLYRAYTARFARARTRHQRDPS
ncbi:MAG: lantibiotic dehydratase [Gammaproteobacteria bacterium]